MKLQVRWNNFLSPSLLYHYSYSVIDLIENVNQPKPLCDCVEKRDWILRRLLAFEMQVAKKDRNEDLRDGSNLSLELKGKKLQANLTSPVFSSHLETNPFLNSSHKKKCPDHSKKFNVSIVISGGRGSNLISQLLDCYVQGNFPIKMVLRSNENPSGSPLGEIEIYPKGGLWRLYNDVMAGAFDFLISDQVKFYSEEPTPGLALPFIKNNAKENQFFSFGVVLSYFKLEIIRSLKRLRVRLLKDKKWFIKIYFPQGRSLILNWYLPDSRFSIADPFIVESGASTYCFVEMQKNLSAKGVISLFEIDMKNSEGVPTFQGVVLEEDFHISFPHVFENDGRYFMLPEQVASGSYWIYEAKDFPRGWEKSIELPFLKNTVDPIIFHFNGSLYLLTSALNPEKIGFSRSLKAFTAERLHGPWKEARVIGTNASVSGRNGGLVHLDDGTILRVVQKTAAFEYGVSGVDIQNVSVMGGEILLERVTEALNITNQLENFEKIHHLNSVNGLVAVDFLEENLKMPKVLAFWKN